LTLVRQDDFGSFSRSAGDATSKLPLRVCGTIKITALYERERCYGIRHFYKGQYTTTKYRQQNTN